MSDNLLKAPVDSAATNKSSHRKMLRWQLPLLAVLVAGGVGGFAYFSQEASHASVPPAAPLAAVTVSNPLQRDVEARLGAIGQFSAINRVELRAQVGGTLSEIHFEDGQIVRKGDLLFVVDPRPYEIKLGQANAASRGKESQDERRQATGECPNAAHRGGQSL